MTVKTCVFPGGRFRALTMSFDDGQAYDRRLVELFSRYGLKGTFHLNSGLLDRPGRIQAAEVKSLYAGHEVALHTLSHPWPQHIARESLIGEVLEDRRNLEALTDYPVVGMSYPFGDYSAQIEELLRQLGVVYSRTTKSTGGFSLPADFLAWHPTCHYKNMEEFLPAFLEPPVSQQLNRPLLFYIWGHSYELERDGGWERMEAFCREVSGRTDCWFATNIEIYRYLTALDRLVFSEDSRMAYNPSAAAVWVLADGRPVEIPAGETVLFG